MKVAQAEDKEAQLLIRYGEKPTHSELRLMDPAMRCYYSCIQQFRMVKGVLYYEWVDDVGSRSLRLFAPRSLRRKIIEGCHDPPSSGHQGEKKTLERVKRSFYWYGLTADVLHYVATCAMCGASKKSARKSRAALQSYVCGAPLDRLHLDFLGPFPASVNNNKYILVITDQFTKWVEAFAVTDKTSETTAKKLVEEFIARFGAPLQIHTDQGRNFQSDLFKAVCKLFGATQTRTTPYHPASNGQVERFNRSLLQMIRCYINRDQTVWDEQLPLLLAAYRSTPHQSTGISPNFMMLGREVHQMTDLVFKDSEAIRKALDHATYIEKLKSALDTAHSVARKSLHKCQQKQKRLHDVRLCNNQYEIGDLVYVNKMAKKACMGRSIYYCKEIWFGAL